MTAKEQTFDLEHKQFTVRVDDNDVLALYVDNCLRKQDDTNSKVAYVWTNIELHWEEHRYVEIRYNRASSVMRITVNGSTLYDEQFSA